VNRTQEVSFWMHVLLSGTLGSKPLALIRVCITNLVNMSQSAHGKFKKGNNAGLRCPLLLVSSLEVHGRI
jgi:hypothetical protein